MRPPPLLPASAARLTAYGAFALVGALEWQRLAVAGSVPRALGWVLAGLVAAALVTRASAPPAGVPPRADAAPRRAVRSPRADAARGRAAGGEPSVGRLVFALVASGLLALVLSGVPLAWFAPRALDELLPGLAGGAQALSTVTLPYAGADPWVVAVVEVSGAGLCWLAGVLVAWPRGGAWARTLALTILLVLAISPTVSVGVEHATLLGVALTVLVAAFLWLDRVARRGAAGLVVLAAVAVAAAVPLAGAADRDDPWFDYQSFSERFGAGAPIAFDWTQRYGPIDWPREGAEVLRARPAGGKAVYLKTQQLDRLDDQGWGIGGGGERELPHADRSGWDTRVAVVVRRLRSPAVPAPGATTRVESPSSAVAPDVAPGPWVARPELGSGDSYVAAVYVPRPSRTELEAATVDREPPGGDSLAAHLTLPIPRDVTDAYPPVVRRRTRSVTSARVSFPPFDAISADEPVARLATLGVDVAAGPLLERSDLRRTWALAQRLRTDAASPYEYVQRVGRTLQDPRFRYDERPPADGDGAPLERFLFDTRAGYCQHYAGAMAVLLRMGGVPARVVTGFSPGARRKGSGEWIVRDTDGHAWVEAWFDGIGWITLDPTPPGSPARNRVAAVAVPKPRALDTTGSSTANDRKSDDPAATTAASADPTPTAGPAARTDDGSPSWLPIGGAVILLAAAATAVTMRHRRREDPGGERALAELERAWRRSGRSLGPGQTLAGLERALRDTEAAAYVGALRAARYGGPAAPPPTRAQRAALRRRLAAGLGPVGRARAWLALPPRPRIRSAPEPR